MTTGQTLPSPADVPTAVAEKISDFELVLNKGSKNGIKTGLRFLIYGHGKEIVDPISKESLGALEIVRGTGVVVHVQERLCTIKSEMTAPAARTIKKSLPNSLLGSSLFGGQTEIEEVSSPPQALPFNNAQRGDFARQI